jgi:hypothetical protein
VGVGVGGSVGERTIFKRFLKKHHMGQCPLFKWLGNETKVGDSFQEVMELWLAKQVRVIS